MSEQSDQASQSDLAAEESGQPFLHQLNAEQEAIEELSDEELEAITGGVSLNTIDFGPGIAHAFEAASHGPGAAHAAEVAHAAPAPAKHGLRIPQAWKAASAGIVSGTLGSGVVGAIAGKIQK